MAERDNASATGPGIKPEPLKTERAGKIVYYIENSMPLTGLLGHWAQILPQQVSKLDKDLSTSELVDLVSTSRARYRIATERELGDFKGKWYELRNKGLIRAIQMMASGNPDIRVANVLDYTQKPDYQDRILFGFRMGGSFFGANVAVSTLAASQGVTSEELKEMVGKFNQTAGFETLGQGGEGPMTLGEVQGRLRGTEEERISNLLEKDFSSDELATIVYKINNGEEYLGTSVGKDTVGYSSGTKHRFLMRAADLKKGGKEGIRICLGEAKDGEGEEVTFFFDRKGKPPYKTRVKADALNKDFSDFREHCEPFDEFPPAN